MRSHLRTVVVVVLAAALLALFLHNVDLWGAIAAIVHARPAYEDVIASARRLLL